jgi:quercetin dioxygenase-like cupin family protein
MPFYEANAPPEREIAPGFRVRFVHGAAMAMARWSVDAGAELPEHRHREQAPRRSPAASR